MQTFKFVKFKSNDHENFEIQNKQPSKLQNSKQIVIKNVEIDNK